MNLFRRLFTISCAIGLIRGQFMSMPAHGICIISRIPFVFRELALNLVRWYECLIMATPTQSAPPPHNNNITPRLPTDMMPEGARGYAGRMSAKVL